jgi:F-type H+-transporting ATPase subunit beta
MGNISIKLHHIQMSTATAVNKGKITQIIGPVVDVSFESEGARIPAILDALKVTKANGQQVILEVSNTLGKTGFAPSPWTRPTACIAA